MSDPKQNQDEPTIKGQVAELRDELEAIGALPWMQKPAALMEMSGRLLALIEAMADAIEGVQE